MSGTQTHTGSDAGLGDESIGALDGDSRMTRAPLRGTTPPPSRS
jgi:hypothetical protein